MKRIVKSVPYEPNKKIIRTMMKCERQYTKTNPKATLKLIRLEKKYMSLSNKLRKNLGL